jgi:hypothetical protein
MRFAALFLLLALAACSPEIIYVYPEPEPPPEEPAAVAEAPVWQPEVGHVYVLDAADAIVTDYAAADLADYRWAVTAWGLTVEQHNLIDDPLGLDPWHLLCGGPPEA